MEQEFNARPINHSGASAVARTAAGAAGNGIKWGFITAILWIGALTALGVAAGAFLGTAWGLGGLGAAYTSWFGAAATTTAGTLTAGAPIVAPTILGFETLASIVTVGLGIAGGFFGFSTGTASAPFVGGAAGAIGAAKGGLRSLDKVSNEQASAYAMQQQLDAYKANAAALASQPVYKLQPGEFAATCEPHMRGGHGHHQQHAEKVAADRAAAAQAPQQQTA